MAERVQVVLEAQDLASGVLRGLVSRFGALGNAVSDASDAFGRFASFMDLAKRSQTDASISADDLVTSYMEAGKSMARLGETIAILLVQTIQEAIKVTDEYNSAIRDLSLVSGEGAENTSRFIQVLDDYELTAEDAMVAAKALKEKGLSPTIDTLAALADEFKKIQDPAERMEFVQDNLGKSGAKWVNVLNQEGDALRKAAAAIDPWLVKTDEQIKKAEVSRLALDELADSWAAFQNKIGDMKNEYIFEGEAAHRASEIMKEQGVIVNSTTANTQMYKDALAQAKEELLASAEASIEYTESMRAQEEAAQKAAEANKELLTGAMQITSDMEAFGERQADSIAKLADLQAEKQDLKNQGWADESEKIQTVQDKIDELKDKYAEDAAAYAEAQKEKAAMNAINAIEMDDGLAGFTEAEYEKARIVAETTGIISAEGLEQQYAMQLLTDELITGGIKAEEYGSILNQVMADGVVSVGEVEAAIKELPDEKTITLNIQTNYSPGTQAALELFSAGEKSASLPGRASGGSVFAGQAYVVGERGAEVFVPQSNGSIIPNGKSGNNNDDIIAALYATRINEATLARSIIEGILSASR